MENIREVKYAQAEKRLEKLKQFYDHLVFYVIVNAAVLILGKKIIFTFFHGDILGNSEIVKYVNWNIYGMPILWGLFLGLHAIYIFGNIPHLYANWEARQMNKYLNKD
ncbi:2TM domain-containing protein [Cellulophaga baltica]|uniref:2TM domain-containing protein n=1 Tax=Cellulophaga TaxID=104264 RepID=UPI001C06BCCD|nr:MULTISPECIES: 2TM domain-containing protein [Cellulophaga]MBU2997351.1 2TM domain-containing protein [Cellulophaga baltica]MDO6768749.1 2TM domain-containing protein [Cellulophaga sp. 1_MG-2023]